MNEQQRRIYEETKAQLPVIAGSHFFWLNMGYGKRPFRDEYVASRHGGKRRPISVLNTALRTLASYERTWMAVRRYGEIAFPFNTNR